MSVRLLSVVWEHAPYEAGTLLVLLAMADYSNDDGQCWPSVESIARKARLGVRQTHNVLRQLMRDGVLFVERGGGRGIHSRYRVCAETLKSISVKPNSVKSVSVKSTPETLQSSSVNRAIHDIAIRKNRKEPSIEPSGVKKENCERCNGKGKLHQMASIPGPRLIPCPDCQMKTAGVSG